MIPVFSEEGRALVEEFARGSCLLAFDFDGTLAPIVRERDEAEMTDTTRALLLALASTSPVAVVSGRGFGDVAERLVGVPVRYIVGNHGGETQPSLGDAGSELGGVERDLVAAFGEDSGIDVEAKGASLAVHYRGTGLRRKVLAVVRRLVDASEGALRLIDGKQVLNVVRTDLPHKGTAILGLLREEGAQKFVYVGDDYTDEDVFELPEGSQGLGIRVGRAKRSAARVFLRNQKEIDRLLRYLVDLRRPGTP